MRLVLLSGFRLLAIFVVACAAVFLTCISLKCSSQFEYTSIWKILVFCLGAGILITLDFRALGVKVAIYCSFAAIAIAWLFVVPVGVFAFPLAMSVPFLSYFLLPLGILCLSYMVLRSISPDKMSITELLQFACICALMLVVCLHSNSALSYQLHVLIIFIAVQRLAQRWIMLSNVSLWPDVEQLDPWSEEFREKVDFFQASCVQWSRMFDFDLYVQKLFRVRPPFTVSQPGYQRTSVDDDRSTRQLFHGTTWESAHLIVSNGFQLPQKAGMFGKGIYFADCALKSWRYAKSDNSQSFICSCCGSGGLMLLCSVELGEQREERKADPTLEGYDRKGWWAWLTGQHGAYDSVKGLPKDEGGVLRVPEYVIYDPAKVRVEYIFEVKPTEQARE